jgi:MFS family permease
LPDTVAPPPPLDEALPPHYAWNARAFVTDFASFNIAMSFIGAGTVMPGLIARLTGSSEIYVGVLNGLVSGFWLLPQLLVAGAVTRMPRKKPIVVRTVTIARPILLLLALMVYFFSASHPSWTLNAILVGFTVFFIADAIASVPWFDLLARSIPARRRGRILGTAQVVGGLGGIGAGFVVRLVLGEHSPWAFPSNYAMLFVLASVAMFGSTLALMFIREPAPKVERDATPPLREVLTMFPRILAQDHLFRRLIITKLLTGFVTMASAFYVLYATRRLGFGPETTGFFVSAQVVGSLTSGLVMGAIQDRLGPLVHMRISIALAAVAPILGLCAGPLYDILGTGVLPFYLLIYFFLGLFTGCMSWPFFNWVMEYASDTWRPLYVGMMNTLGAIIMLAPALGGWIASTLSYPAVFALALAFAGAAMLSSLRLSDTRQARTAPVSPGPHPGSS